MKEEWKNFHPKYQVSNTGYIRSIKTGKTLKNNTSGNKRYATINLYLDGKKATHLVHRLVATYFVINKDNKPQVNHIDGDRFNNISTNLEWVTASENTIHAYRNNLNKSVGERHPKTGLLEAEVKAIRLLHGVKTLGECSNFFGVSKSVISNIYRGDTWKYLD